MTCRTSFRKSSRRRESLRGSLIFDGEVVAWKDGRVLPFSLLQRRLGRKRPTTAMMEEIPVALMIFDVLFADGETLIDDPLSQRKSILNSIEFPPGLQIAPFQLIDGRVPLEPFFAEAEGRRNEGLMLKSADSTYAPGKRGMSWLKWKKALATLDVVVTGVEFGHGRRRDVLSDYTFAVQHDGKASQYRQGVLRADGSRNPGNDGVFQTAHGPGFRAIPRWSSRPWSSRSLSTAFRKAIATRAALRCAFLGSSAFGRIRRSRYRYAETVRRSGRQIRLAITIRQSEIFGPLSGSAIWEIAGS